MDASRLPTSQRCITRLEAVQDVDEVIFSAPSVPLLIALRKGVEIGVDQMSPLTFGQQNFVFLLALSRYGRCGRFGLWLWGRVRIRAIERGVVRDIAHRELLELERAHRQCSCKLRSTHPRFHAPLLALGNDLAVVHVPRTVSSAILHPGNCSTCSHG